MDEPDASHPHVTESRYGRVTNARRFALLHSVALDVLDELQRDFAVMRVEPYENGEDLEQFTRVPLARATVALLPEDPGGAPLIVAFSSFPGLLVRVGRYYDQPFPSCGCDACDETAEAEVDRFRRLVDAVTTGQFREYVTPVGDGTQVLVWELESAGQRCRAQLFLTSTQASALKPISQWKPWVRR